MDTSLVTYTLQDRAAYLTINRPDRNNALNFQVLQELRTLFSQAEQDSHARVVVLTGAGEKTFCAGADIDSFQSQTKVSGEQLDFRAVLAGLFEQMAALSKPIVARVNGFALGGGMGLALACDIVLASENARFGLPEIHLGLFPMVIMPVLFRSIGRKKLLELMFTGDRITATEAEHWGLINHVVAPGDLDGKVHELVSKLADKSGMTLKLGRQAFYTMSEMDFSHALAYLQGMLSACLNTADAREGLNAFLEKRPPQWTDS